LAKRKGVMEGIRIMNDLELSEYRQALFRMQASLREDIILGREGQKTVELDQQSVGRLSRMDALQHQAMAKASQSRRGLMEARIKAAFLRMEENEFGYCTDCGEEIAPKRLALDPTIPLCLSCASG